MNPNTPASAPKNPLRANTAFQRTAAALALNQLSDAMSLITITFMVIAMNGSPELASLVLFCCSFTAITAGIISGTIVDRMTPRRALILSCTTQTLGWVGVLTLSMSGSHSIVALTLILVLLTAASQLDYPSEQKIIAATVPVTDLGRASAIGQARESAANLFGAPIGCSTWWPSPWFPAAEASTSTGRRKTTATTPRPAAAPYRPPTARHLKRPPGYSRTSKTGGGGYSPTKPYWQ